MRIPLLALIAVSGRGALAWGAAGHEIVATIAQIYLHPTVVPVICEILNTYHPDPNSFPPACHLAPIAAWADRIKYRMRWSSALHYVGAVGDYPSETCIFPGDKGWEGARGINVLGGIRNTTNILEEWSHSGSASNERANEALKFLVHFVGDLHMPLHLTARDRGGNSDKVRFGGRLTNLHSLWDGLLLAKAIRTVPQNYSRPLPIPAVERNLRDTIYDSYVRRIIWQGILGKWKDEVPGWLACPAVPPAVETSNVWQQVMSLWSRARGYQDSPRTDDDIICPQHWASPIHSLNCEIVWPKELDEPPYGRSRSSCLSTNQPCRNITSPGPVYLELDTPEYAGFIEEHWIVEKLMAQAGIRLAAILNWLFADVEEANMVIGGLKVT